MQINLIKSSSYHSIMATTVEEHPIEGSVAMDSRNLQTEVGTPTAAPSGAIATDAAPANAGEEITREERYRRLRAVIKPDLDPSLVWPTLRDRGWACKPGRGLVSYYIVCSKFADESVAFMLKNAVRGDEYFCSEDELKVFCREKLGWVGASGNGSDINRRDRRPSSRHGRASSRHQNMPSGSKGAETTPSTAKKRPSSPEAQQIPHANAKRHAVESKRDTVATGAPHKLRFTTDTDATPSTLAIKRPSEATLQNVLQALASPTEYDPDEELWETETAHPPVDGEEAMDQVPQNDDVSTNYDSDATVPKSMPEPMPMSVPDEHLV